MTSLLAGEASPPNRLLDSANSLNVSNLFGGAPEFGGSAEPNLADILDNRIAVPQNVMWEQRARGEHKRNCPHPGKNEGSQNRYAWG